MFKLYLRRYVKVTSKTSAETRGVFRTPLNAYISAWELQLLVTIEREDHTTFACVHGLVKICL